MPYFVKYPLYQGFISYNREKHHLKVSAHILFGLGSITVRFFEAGPVSHIPNITRAEGAPEMGACRGGRRGGGAAAAAQKQEEGRSRKNGST